MSKAPVPRLFPQLQPQVCQDKDQEKSHVSVRTDKIKPVKSFKMGDTVLVYDNITKLNSKGTIFQVKSNNSYLVNVNDRIKHISGDNLTFISDDNFINVQSPESIVDDSNDFIDVNEDTNSEISESDDEMEVYSYKPKFYVQRKHYRNEAQKLRDNLSSDLPVSH